MLLYCINVGFFFCGFVPIVRLFGFFFPIFFSLLPLQLAIDIRDFAEGGVFYSALLYFGMFLVILWHHSVPVEVIDEVR